MLSRRDRLRQRCFDLTDVFTIKCVVLCVSEYFPDEQSHSGVGFTNLRTVFVSYKQPNSWCVRLTLVIADEFTQRVFNELADGVSVGFTNLRTVFVSYKQPNSWFVRLTHIVADELTQRVANEVPDRCASFIPNADPALFPDNTAAKCRPRREI